MFRESEFVWTISDYTGELYEAPVKDQICVLPYDKDFNQGDQYILRYRGVTPIEEIFSCYKNAVIGLIIAAEKRIVKLGKEIDEKHLRIEKYCAILDMMEDEFKTQLR